jgi:membrane-associated HD superfamily phosphohydrolase
VAQKRNEFYNAQVKGWRAYTKNINGGEFINAKDYLESNTSERIKGLLSDKDFEKILTGLMLPILLILVSIFFKEKIKINKINISSNILIILFLLTPLLIWLTLFPQSRYGYFSYISFIIFYISFYYFKIGKFNHKLVVTSFSILLIFLVTKNSFKN